MKVFKFGGASVKDAKGVINLSEILKANSATNIIVVLSAMGKTTNALEAVVDSFITDKSVLQEKLNIVKNFHQEICNHLFPKINQKLLDDLHNLYVALEWELDTEQYNANYDMVYDQVVCFGELISTQIVSTYLTSVGITNQLLDARDVIKTDDTFREGKVNWEETEILLKKKHLEIIKESNQIIITQGFLGGTSENYSCTLGREGSDYTASIIAYCLNAQDVTIWKDVPGVMNADPKITSEAVILPLISYHDAIELAYFGATVIHPKTLKPLQNKNIPLYVKSFLKYNEPGTMISETRATVLIPCLIYKPEQLMLSISPKDFSFIVEENLGSIFTIFSKHRIKVNMMQNSALSLTISIDKDDRRTPNLIAELKLNYKVLYNSQTTLVTIRNYTEEFIKKTISNKKVLMEQKSRSTAQIVIQ